MLRLHLLQHLAVHLALAHRRQRQRQSQPTCLHDGFSDNIRDVFTPFGFEEQIQRLDDAFGAVPFVAWPVTCSR